MYKLQFENENLCTEPVKARKLLRLQRWSQQRRWRGERSTRDDTLRQESRGTCTFHNWTPCTAAIYLSRSSSITTLCNSAFSRRLSWKARIWEGDPPPVSMLGNTEKYITPMVRTSSNARAQNRLENDVVNEICDVQRKWKRKAKMARGVWGGAGHWPSYTHFQLNTIS